MPYIHTAQYRVRHYECNAHGDVHQANYLRYMQEAAFDASDAVGYGAARYIEIGYQWLAYETEIDYLYPLRYGDSFTVKTWVENFRRVRSLRRYEFYRDEVCIAQANTDWVLIDTRTNYPASIPQEIIDAYAQGDPVERSDHRKSFPRLPQHPPNTHQQQYYVTWRDIDGAQHVNNAIYLHYAQNTERTAPSPFDHITHRQQIEYKFPAMLDDAITVTTWISDEDADAFQRHFVITRAEDDKLLTRITAYNRRKTTQ